MMFRKILAVAGLLLSAAVSVVALVGLVAVCLGERALAGEAVPDRLTIGYEHEGQIDASMPACLATVKEVTEWDAAATEKGARDVCAARKRHVEAYAALQSSYRTFVEAYSVDRRLSLADAVSSFKTLVKACIDHKFGLTTGGHNIMIDIIENDIATRCLALGSNLLKDETKKYKALQ
jgi:hypothetical protein